MFILLFINISTILHILLHILFFFILWYNFFFFSYIYVYSLVLCYNILHCPLSGPDLIYISLLIIFCIIEYDELNLESLKIHSSK